MKLIAAEYFAGIGLVRMGLEKAGWSIAYANDFSEKKFEMYETFFPGANKHYVVADVFDIDPTTIPHTTLATCSFPCIDLSLAGNMGGISGKHSSAFWGFINILKAQGDLAPPLVMVENVPGWLTSNKGEDFRVTVQALNDLGYACDVFTLDARRFTPQSRLRVFLVGAKFDVPYGGKFNTLKRPKSLLPSSLRKSISENWKLNWFYINIPEPPPLLNQGLSNIVELIDDSDKRWWSEKEVKRHLEMMDISHRERVENLALEDKISYRTFYRRRRNGYQRAEVRHDDTAGCLRTAVGGSGKQFIIKAGKGRTRMRTMTAREYARLQGVPDEYPITVDGVQALTGFGDAVCVPAISWIGENVLNPLIDKYLSEDVLVVRFYGRQPKT